MRLPPARHRWRLTPRQAVSLQRHMAQWVVEDGGLSGVRWVAGLDVAFSVDGQACLGAAVVWDRVTGEVTERVIARRRLGFPYVPGLLSFREAPVLLAALRRLRGPVDVLLCDGQGRAHPRGFGLACHVGLLSGLPAVGCAKSILTGTHGPLGCRRGEVADLCLEGRCIGRLVRTRPGVRPVVVSVGHRASLDEAVELVLACATRYRLPEPTRLADQLSRLARRREFA